MLERGFAGDLEFPWDTSAWGADADPPYGFCHGMGLCADIVVNQRSQSGRMCPASPSSSEAATTPSRRMTSSWSVWPASASWASRSRSCAARHSPGARGAQHPRVSGFGLHRNQQSKGQTWVWGEAGICAKAGQKRAPNRSRLSSLNIVGVSDLLLAYLRTAAGESRVALDLRRPDRRSISKRSKPVQSRLGVNPSLPR